MGLASFSEHLSQSPPALTKRRLRPQQGRAAKGISSKNHRGSPAKWEIQPGDQRKVPGQRASCPEVPHTPSPIRGHALGNVSMLLGYPTSSAEGLQGATAPVLLKTPPAPKVVQDTKGSSTTPWLLIQDLKLFRPKF